MGTVRAGATAVPAPAGRRDRLPSQPMSFVFAIDRLKAD